MSCITECTTTVTITTTTTTAATAAATAAADKFQIPHLVSWLKALHNRTRLYLEQRHNTATRPIMNVKASKNSTVDNDDQNKTIGGRELK